MNVVYNMCVFDMVDDYNENAKIKDILYKAAQRHARYITIKFSKYSYNIVIPYEYINDCPNFLVSYQTFNRKKFREWVEKEFKNYTIKQWFNLDKEEL